MQPILKNTGVILEHVNSHDLIYGSNDRAKDYVFIEDGNWTGFYSDGELQYSTYYDSMACVSFSAIKVVSAIMNFRIRKGLINASNLKFLNDNGYINEKGDFDASERFTAKMSGTTSKGNSGRKVWHSIRHDGLIPQALWTWDRGRDIPQVQKYFDWFYNEIPQRFKDIGKEFAKRFDILYEIVLMNEGNIKRAMQKSPIQLFIPTSCPYKKTIQQYCDGSIGHAVSLIDDREHYYALFDHYIKQAGEKGNERYIRRVVKNYKFNPYGYVATIEDKVIELHRKPFDLIKQHGISSIYFYGMDKMWHGFGDMDILRTFKDEYKKEDLEYVETLPSNISFTLKK